MFPNTQKYIPGGFNLENASKLGYATISADNNFVLISYLDRTLNIVGMYEIDNATQKFYFQNNYVVFIDNSFANIEAIDFHWDLKLLRENVEINLPNQKTIKEKTGNLYISDDKRDLFISDDKRDLFKGQNLNDTKLLVRCVIRQGDKLTQLRLIHDLAQVFTMESDNSLVNSDYVTEGAHMALLSNNYSSFFTINNDTNGDWWLPVVTSILFQNIQSKIEMVVEDENLTIKDNTKPVALEKTINQSNFQNTPIEKLSTALKETIGICGLNICLSGLFLKNGNNTFLNQPTLLPSDENQFFTSLVTQFRSLSIQEKVNLFNSIKFPKSNIKATEMILSELTEDARDLLRDNELSIEYNDLFLKIIHKHFTGLAASEISKPKKKSYAISALVWSDVIDGLLNRSRIPVEKFRIQFLDIRSGRPLAKGTRVRFIRLISKRGQNDRIIWNPALIQNTRNGNEPVQTGFDFDKDKNTLHILAKLGYYSPANGDKTAQKDFKTKERIKALNDYFATRIIDGDEKPIVFSLDESDPKKPKPEPKIPAKYLHYIRKEYKSISRIGENGILTIPIHKSLLDNRLVEIEIGLWEYPIVREQYVQSTEQGETSHLRRPTGAENPENGTTFRITWIGDDNTPSINNAQSIDWQENASGNRHFGWKARIDDSNFANLRMCEKLTIKSNDGAFADFNRTLYNREGSIHMTVFAMQWCQPVWAPIPATATHKILGSLHPRTHMSRGTFVPITEDERNNPIMVTNWRSGGSYDGGRDYGSLFPRNDNSEIVEGFIADLINSEDLVVAFNRIRGGTFTSPPRGSYSSGDDRHPYEEKPHHGIDYYAISNNSKVFVLNGGKIESMGLSNGYGLCCNIQTNKIHLRVGHLTNGTGGTLIIANSKVLTGQFVGLAGKSFRNLGAAAPDDVDNTNTYHAYPVHLHFEIGLTSTRRYLHPKVLLDDFNKHLILENTSYKIFPCDCEGNGGDGNPQGKKCSLRNDRGIIQADRRHSICNTCWAYKNLHCPYLRADYENDRNNIARQRAQLLFLYLREQRSGAIPHNRYLNPKGAETEDPNDANLQSLTLALTRFRLRNPNDTLDTIVPYPRTDLNRVNPQIPANDTRYNSPENIGWNTIPEV